MPKEKVESVSNTIPAPKPKYDFTNVNLETGEGMQVEFSSWDEMDEYFDAFADACDKAGVRI
jgi:hypothetical protein